MLLQVFNKNSKDLLQQLLLQMGKVSQMEEAMATMALAHQQKDKVRKPLG